MASNPPVSVFMPVYNAGEYLYEAIQSILDQTFTDFEFVIVNDGSKDQSASVISSFKDPRIRLIDMKENRGLIASLNTGLEECLGKYIVRMDQDDISLPQRIERQYAFMEKNPDVGLIGSWFEDFGDQVVSRAIHYSGDDTEIRIRHLYQTHISHPTAVIRSSVVQEHGLRFDPSFLHGEDYHFWVRMSEYCKLSNVPEVLVRKRDHPTNISNAFSEVQRNTCNKVKRLQFDKMGASLSMEEAELYTRFADPEWNFTSEEMLMLLNMLHRIYVANNKSRFIDPIPYATYLAEKWFHLCLQNPLLGSRRQHIYKQLSFSNAYHAGTLSLAKLRVKSLFA